MILLALGSNLPSKFGDSKCTIMKACEVLTDRGLVIDRLSHLYRTAPVPVSDQPWFVNAVASIKTKIDPYAVLRVLQDVEAEFGLKPLERNGARTLDLDLLSYQRRVISDAYLDLPHARMSERAFVLYPLIDIAPDWVHPLTKKTTRQMFEELPAGQEISRFKSEAA